MGTRMGAGLTALAILVVISYSQEISGSTVEKTPKFSPEEWAHIEKNCLAEKPDDAFLYWDDFPWKQNREDVEKRAKALYVSPKRLKTRAYYDAVRGQFVFPKDSTRAEAVIPTRFLVGVRTHVEQALRLGYADSVIFSDMGHSHFFLPEKIYQENYTGIWTPESLTAFLNEPSLKVLYHTAEQIELAEKDESGESYPVKDKWSGWRYYTRNVVGMNDGSARMEVLLHQGDGYNTLRDYEGHHYSAGFNLSANEKGCFPYRHKGETKWFDLSMEDIGMDPAVAAAGGA